MLEQALYYLNSGLQALPAHPDKRPWGNWRDLQLQLLTPDQLTQRCRDYARTAPLDYIGILTGQVSGGLEVIDVDCKYDLTGTLYLELKQLIDDNLPDVANRFVIDQTPSGGYHIYYRTDVVEGNKKLARRPTTPEEQAKDRNDKMKVLVETRGEGGFIVVPPTAGYELIQGDFADLPHLSDEDRKILFSIARSFNEEPNQPHSEPRPSTNGGQPTGGSSPFADYNQRGDVVSMLVHEFGWSEVNQQGQRVNLKRPGQSDTKTSGNFHEGLRKLYVFSSSTEFEPEQAYSPADVFILLKCNGDKKEAARQLLEMGYGERGTYQQKGSRVETASIHVEASDANGVPADLTSDGYLTSERIKETPMDAAYIYYTGQQSTGEVIQALDLLEKTSPVKVYLVEVANLSDKTNRIKTRRGYEYRAYDINRRYDQLYQEAEAAGREMEAEDQDRLIREFVSVGVAIGDPIERGRFEGLVLQFADVNGFDITRESLAEGLKKLRYDQQTELQRSEFDQLLKDATTQKNQGNLADALDALADRSRQIKARNHADTFGALTVPITEAGMTERLKLRALDIPTDYVLEGQEIVIPAGALTVIAAPTNHGKTTFMINLALRIADKLPAGKKVYFLSYEEDADSITISALNTYVAMNISVNNRKTIQSYYREGGSVKYIKEGQRAGFAKAKTTFFDTLISTGRLNIQYVGYDSDTLMEAIQFLHKSGDAGAIIIDYVQLLHKGQQGRNKYSSRQLEIQQICIDLKDVAVNTGLPMILGAQFNRDVVNPGLMHETRVREAADIEQIAHLLIGFWNNKKMKMGSDKDWLNLANYDIRPGIYAVVFKNRSGDTGQCGMLSFDGNQGLIENEAQPAAFNNPFE